MKDSKQTFFLGTAVKISSVINMSGCSSVKLTLYDSAGVAVVDSADMTADTSTAFSYIYQSVTTGNSGDYIVHIDATYGSYVGRKEVVFTLEPLYST